MPLILIAFLAGILTALAPCVLPIIPAVVGGSVGGKQDRKKPYIVVTSLFISIVLFTLLLKGSAYQHKGFWGAVLIGAALGPVFSSCSPVYLFILSTVLPGNFISGLIHIMAYALGLCLILLLVGIFGQKLINKFKWASNPYGWFKRSLGVLLVIAGLLIITRLDRQIQQFVIDRGILDITQVELKLLK